MAVGRTNALSVVTLGGLPGSGTTTAVTLLRPRLDLPSCNMGDIFRRMAAKQGLPLNAFGEYVRCHPDVDRRLDEEQVAVARGGNVILEGRLSGFMVRRAGVPALTVWLDAAAAVRYARVAARERLALAEAAEISRAREEGERRRYLENYGFDLDDRSYYDLTLDTGLLGPAAVADCIAAAFARALQPVHEPAEVSREHA